jgi:2-iminobutanoate/2-iminopropanoate deaminase
MNCCLLVSFIALCLIGCAPLPTKEAISTKDAPSAIGPYSQAIKAGNTLYLSGQIPLDPKSGQLIVGSIEEQTKQVLENLKAVLAANDMSMEDIVTTTVFLRDMNDFAKMNAAYGNYFRNVAPARATVQAARLPRDVAVEISATAVK